MRAEMRKKIERTIECDNTGGSRSDEEEEEKEEEEDTQATKRAFEESKEDNREDEQVQEGQVQVEMKAGVANGESIEALIAKYTLLEEKHIMRVREDVALS